MELLTRPWAEAWGKALSRSAAFAAAAGRFSGRLGFVMSADPAAGVDDERAVLVEVDRGSCSGVRPVLDDELRSARYILKASPAIWRDVVLGRLDAVSAVLSGRLRLARGSLLTIGPHLAMARELLAVASGLETNYPGEPA
jgi:hypothetical protein